MLLYCLVSETRTFIAYQDVFYHWNYVDFGIAFWIHNIRCWFLLYSLLLIGSSFARPWMFLWLSGSGGSWVSQHYVWTLHLFSRTYDCGNLTVPATLWLDRNCCGHHLLPVGSDLHCLAFAALGVVGPGSPPLGRVMLALVQLGKSIFVPSSDSFRSREIKEWSSLRWLERILWAFLTFM